MSCVKQGDVIPNITREAFLIELPTYNPIQSWVPSLLLFRKPWSQIQISSVTTDTIDSELICIEFDVDRCYSIWLQPGSGITCPNWLMLCLSKHIYWLDAPAAQSPRWLLSQITANSSHINQNIHALTPVLLAKLLKTTVKKNLLIESSTHITCEVNQTLKISQITH